eukprot:1160555-Pelagomonas_calceolata.AAC.5
MKHTQATVHACPALTPLQGFRDKLRDSTFSQDLEEKSYQSKLMTARLKKEGVRRVTRGVGLQPENLADRLL